MGLFSKKAKSASATGALPTHVAIIMDGNGRWAKKRGLPRSAGHTAGAATLKSVARYCNKLGIRYLTVYAFSTENWKRSQEEIDGIMEILRANLMNTVSFKDDNMRLTFIGDRSRLAPDLVELIEKAEADSRNATGTQVNIALNYGGRDEIVHAVRRVVEEGLAPDAITEQTITDRLYTAGIPDPDLVIRTSGEFRFSNYLIWQTAYAEFWIADVLWPDFSERDMDAAIAAYGARDRRFGGRK